MSNKLRQTKETMTNLAASRYGKTVVVLTGIAASAVARADTDPMAGFVTSITTSATNLVTTLASVAGAALPLFALFYGCKAAIRIFKTIK